MSSGKRPQRRGRRFRAQHTPTDPDALADLFFAPAQRVAGPDRKTLQLCRQALRALTLALGECGDPVLQSLLVQQVVPAPTASCLLVSVASSPGQAVPLTQVLEHLGRASSFLRARVAEAIVRRKAPELLFQVVGGQEVNHERE